MGLVHRGNGVYFYRSERCGNRVVTRYVASGAGAQLMVKYADLAKSQRELAKYDREAEREQHRRELDEFRDVLARVNGIVADALTAGGWYRHRREWRARRGAAMNALATTRAKVYDTWVTDDITAAVGKFPEGLQAKAAAGNRSDFGAVNKFLSDNPAAVTLWGDLGRHVLVKILSGMNSKDHLFQISFIKFASDLRRRLAGPEPNALELLLAERVVIAWAFVHSAELTYANQCNELTIRQSEFQFKKIDLANRNLMAACRTLAKVKRRNYLDVLELVSAKPHQRAA